MTSCSSRALCPALGKDMFPVRTLQRQVSPSDSAPPGPLTGLSLPPKKTRQNAGGSGVPEGIQRRPPFQPCIVSNRRSGTQGQMARLLGSLFLWPQHRAEYWVVSIREKDPSHERSQGNVSMNHAQSSETKKPLLPLGPCVFKSPDSAASLIYQLVIARSMFTAMTGQNRAEPGRTRPPALEAPGDAHACCSSPRVWAETHSSQPTPPTELQEENWFHRLKIDSPAFGEAVPGGWPWGAR